MWDKLIDNEKTILKLRNMFNGIDNTKLRKSKRLARRKLYLAILLTQLCNGSRISEAVHAILSFYYTKKTKLEVPIRKRRSKKDYRSMIIPDFITYNSIKYGVESYIDDLKLKEVITIIKSDRVVIYDFKNTSKEYRESKKFPVLKALEDLTDNYFDSIKSSITDIDEHYELYYNNNEFNIYIATCVALIHKITSNVKPFAIRELGFNTHSCRYSKVSALSKKGIDGTIITKILGHSDPRTIMNYTRKIDADTVLEESINEVL